MNKLLRTLSRLIPVIFVIGCADNPSTYSILIEQEDFLQSPATKFNSKVDILWVVDTSGSMAPYQDNLAQNFNSFISSFATKGFDFHMAVVGTDAWKRETDYDGYPASVIYTSSADRRPTLATYEQLGHFRDGDIYGECTGGWTYNYSLMRWDCRGDFSSVRSGVYLLTKNTPNILDVFATNIRAGVRGDGSERGLQSMRAALRINEDGTPGYGGETHTALAQFRRSEAFFSVIFVADEDDQSTRQDGSSYGNGSQGRNNYVNAFVDMMDTYTHASPDRRRYNVSSIVMENRSTCQGGAHESASNGVRYKAIAEATQGVATDICSPSFAEDLTIIAENVVAMVSRFPLSREPIPSSIRVTISEEPIPEDDLHGWSYFIENGTHYIGLNGDAIPSEGEPVSITYDPVTVRE